MENTKKMTNAAALEFVLANYELPTEVAEKVAKIAESYRNKSANRKPTKTQEVNVGIKETIKAVLAEAGKPVTITEMMGMNEELGALTNQKISALMTQLGEKGTGEVVKTVDKKKAYFTLA